MKSIDKETAISQEMMTFYLSHTKITIIGEIWKSRAKLLRNRLFKKIASATE